MAQGQRQAKVGKHLQCGQDLTGIGPQTTSSAPASDSAGRAVRRWFGCGDRRRTARVTTPSVPSAPQNTLLSAYPAVSFCTMRNPGQTDPFGRTTSSPSTGSTILPKRTTWLPRHWCRSSRQPARCLRPPDRAGTSEPEQGRRLGPRRTSDRARPETGTRPLKGIHPFGSKVVFKIKGMDGAARED